MMGFKSSEMIKLRRAYDPPGDEQTRFLVERLWPRGVKKASLQIDAWLREVAPSTALRKWFAHDPAKWREFRRRYFEELDLNPQVWQPILDAAQGGTVTLIYSSHDTLHNNAVALKDYLEAKMAHPRVPRRKSAG